MQSNVAEIIACHPIVLTYLIGINFTPNLTSKSLLYCNMSFIIANRPTRLNNFLVMTNNSRKDIVIYTLFIMYNITQWIDITTLKPTQHFCVMHNIILASERLFDSSLTSYLELIFAVFPFWSIKPKKAIFLTLNVKVFLFVHSKLIIIDFLVGNKEFLLEETWDKSLNQTKQVLPANVSRKNGQESWQKKSPEKRFCFFRCHWMSFSKSLSEMCW